MDVRGPADSHDVNDKVSQLRQKLMRIETAAAAQSPNPHHFAENPAATETVRLIQKLKAVPEVREELVTQTIAKLREGYYSTRKSAEETAEAVLRAAKPE